MQWVFHCIFICTNNTTSGRGWRPRRPQKTRQARFVEPYLDILQKTITFVKKEYDMQAADPHIVTCKKILDLNTKKEYDMRAADPHTVTCKKILDLNTNMCYNIMSIL